MILLFADEHDRTEKEITGILFGCGANIVAGNRVAGRGGFTVAVMREPVAVGSCRGAAVFGGGSADFAGQRLPDSVTGICEEGDLPALTVFQNSGVPVITCGMDQRNTVTLSSLTETSALVALQRSLQDNFGREITPGEFKIALCRRYSPFAIMASAAALLTEGMHPERF